MRKRRIIVGAAIAVACCSWVSGCAGNSAAGPDVSRTVSGDSKYNPVEETIQVPTADIMPSDVPPGLRVSDASDAVPAPFTDEQVMETYRIGPTDVLGFRSFDDETLNGSVVVRHDGMISLPWISDLKVGGLTREEATSVVQEAYKTLYYEAEVSLQIEEATSKTYTVMGDVNQPAQFPYLKPITLLDAIISAGGLRVNQRGGDSFVGGQGQLVKAYIVRGTGEDRTATEYDLRHIEKGGSHETQTPLLPGDTVYIPEGLNLAYVLGAVGRPGIQPLSEGMTLLQLLAAVGGFNDSAARLKQVVLIRDHNEDQTDVQLIDVKTMLRFGGDMIVQPGDVLYVPRKRLVTLGEFISRSTELVTPIMGVMSQTLGLYSQVYDAFYEKQRIDLLYHSDQSDQLQTNLQLLEVIRDLGSAADDFGGTN